MRKKQYKKMKKQLNNNLSSLIRTSIYPQTTQPSSPSWKRPIYLKFFVFFNVGHFFSTLDNVFFQISSCETIKFKRTNVEIKNTFNYVSIHNTECQSDIERARQRRLLRSFQHLFPYASHNRPTPVTTAKWPL